MLVIITYLSIYDFFFLFFRKRIIVVLSLSLSLSYIALTMDIKGTYILLPSPLYELKSYEKAYW